MIRKDEERGTVEFLLERDAADTPYLMGSWDGWQRPGIPMFRQPGETPTWITEVQLPPGEHQFRYRIGDEWFNDSSADTVENGMGGWNSVVVVEDAPEGAGRGSSPTKPRRDVW